MENKIVQPLPTKHSPRTSKISKRQGVAVTTCLFVLVGLMLYLINVGWDLLNHPSAAIVVAVIFLACCFIIGYCCRDLVDSDGPTGAPPTVIH